MKQPYSFLESEIYLTPLHVHSIGTQCPYYSRSYRNHNFENFILDRLFHIL